MRPVLPLMLTAALVACGSSSAAWVEVPVGADTTGTPITIVGTVQYSSLEGGFYAIKTRDGTAYDPTNLPEEFQKDGLRVEAEARRQDGMAGIHQAGPIVTLIRIRAR